MERSLIIVAQSVAEARKCASDLENAGWGVTCVPTHAAASEALRRRSFDAVVTDLRLADGSGFDVVVEAQKRHPATAAFVVVDASSGIVAGEAAPGATALLRAPLNGPALVTALRSLDVDERHDPDGPVAQARWRAQFAPELIGEDPALREVCDTLRRVADTDCTVLVLGESGTGKELISRALHRSSRRKAGPFVPLNCAAVPESLMESELFGHSRGAFTGATTARVGRFAAADGGTIFLDEIGEMPLTLQAKILRVMQDREYTPIGETDARYADVRIVAATHRDLGDMVERGEFREDLLYRLAVIPVRLPALRERLGDIPLLTAHFIARANARHGRKVMGVDASARERLLSHHWPGNVRELENAVERAVILRGTGMLSARDFSDLGRPMHGRLSVLPRVGSPAAAAAQTTMAAAPAAHMPPAHAPIAVAPALPMVARTHDGGEAQQLAASDVPGASGAVASGSGPWRVPVAAAGAAFAAGLPEVPSDLPETGFDLKGALEEFESAVIQQALARTGGNQKRAAAILGLNRTTLVEKLRRKRELTPGTGSLVGGMPFAAAVGAEV